MFELIAQQSESELLQFIKTLDTDVLSVAVILTVVGTFGSLIVISVTWLESRKKIKLAKIQKETVDDLLNRGYKLEEVERLVFGQSGWEKFCGIFGKKEAPDGLTPDFRHPVPPKKHSA